VVFAGPAERELRRLPADAASRLAGPIAGLTVDQHPAGSGKIRGSDYWRLRVGDLRIVYSIESADRTIVVLRVARRAESTYRRLPRQ